MKRADRQRAADAFAGLTDHTVPRDGGEIARGLRFEKCAGVLARECDRVVRREGDGVGLLDQQQALLLAMNRQLEAEAEQGERRGVLTAAVVQAPIRPKASPSWLSSAASSSISASVAGSG